jgi:hypothetical protein
MERVYFHLPRGDLERVQRAATHMQQTAAQRQGEPKKLLFRGAGGAREEMWGGGECTCFLMASRRASPSSLASTLVAPPAFCCCSSIFLSPSCTNAFVSEAKGHSARFCAPFHAFSRLRVRNGKRPRSDVAHGARMALWQVYHLESDARWVVLVAAQMILHAYDRDTPLVPTRGLLSRPPRHPGLRGAA